MAAMNASVVIGSRRGFATTLSPTQTASYPAASACRAIVQHSSTGGRRADCMMIPRVGIRIPMRIGYRRSCRPMNSRMSAMHFVVSALGWPMKPCFAPGKCTRSMWPPAFS